MHVYVIFFLLNTIGRLCQNLSKCFAVIISEIDVGDWKPIIHAASGRHLPQITPLYILSHFTESRYSYLSTKKVRHLACGPGGCRFDTGLRKTLFTAICRLSLLMHVRKAVSGSGKKSCVGFSVKIVAETHRDFTDRLEMARKHVGLIVSVLVGMPKC